jgi:hypothetical protein
MFVESSTSLNRYSMGSTVEEKHVSYNVLLIIAFIATIWIILFICVIFKIYKKFTGKIMPNHIFQMNLFTTFILKCSYVIFVYIHTMAILPGPSDLCPHYFFGLVIFISLNVDMFIMQVDRFAAVFWSLHYPGFANNGRAVLVCVVSKIFNTAVSSLVVFLDKDYLGCVRVFPLLLTQTMNMVLISCLQLCVTVIVFIVSSYMGYKMVHIKKSVTPKISIRRIQSEVPRSEKPQTKSNYKRHITHVRRIDDQPNMFYTIEMRETSIVKDTHIPNHVHFDQSTIDMDKPTHVQEQGNGNTINNDSNSNGIFLMAKTALNMNYVVILNCLINTPLSIMTIIYWNCDQAKGDCDGFLLFNKLMITPRVLAICAGFIIFYYKIKKSDS